jgi:hypothetical protein
VLGVAGYLLTDGDDPSDCASEGSTGCTQEPTPQDESAPEGEGPVSQEEPTDEPAGGTGAGVSEEEAPIGTEIVSWHWVGVPDKYKGPRAFPTYDDAEAWAGKTSGAAIGSVVVDRNYRAAARALRQDAPVFPTPEEAEADAERLGRRGIRERLWFQARDGERFAVYGALE